MKSKTIIFRISVITGCFLFIFGLAKSFCEEQNKSFEQALKNYDTQKQKEQDELATKLNFRLSQAIDNWVDTAKKDKSAKLNTRLKQEWEKLTKFYPISPIHYEYSLRGYKYKIIKSDIAKTDSLTSPYKAVVIIREELYVEKNHSPNISDADPYFFTVSTNYVLNFEYKNEKFNLIDSNDKIVSIENDCPDEIKRLRL
jgi:hypothetical protein